MDGDVVAMSAKERERAHVIRQVADRRMRQGRAAELLGVGVRQIKRLVVMGGALRVGYNGRSPADMVT